MIIESQLEVQNAQTFAGNIKKIGGKCNLTKPRGTFQLHVQPMFPYKFVQKKGYKQSFLKFVIIESHRFKSNITCTFY
jgi:hypothetical protein